MANDYIIVDDFYADPAAIRTFALACDYDDVSALNYPGFQSRKAFYSTAMIEKMEKSVGKKFTFDPSGSISFGQFRIILAEGKSRIQIHYDAEDWAGVLYLSLPEHCQGGTGFFRHKATGLQGPPSVQELQTLAIGSYDDFEKNIIEKDTLNDNAWEMTDFVDAKFNRLLLFRGSKRFHSHVGQFGRERANARLTQNFFFCEAKPNDGPNLGKTLRHDASDDELR